MSAAGEGTGQHDEQGRTQIGRALVLVVVAAVVAVLVLRHTGTTAGRPAALAGAAAATTTTTTKPGGAPSPTSTTTLPLIAPADTTIEVLNGIQVGPLAGNLTGRLRAAGYKTLAPDNTTVVTRASAIYVVQSTYFPTAEKLAATLGFAPGEIPISSVPSTAPIPPGRSTGTDLIVIIGTSLQSVASFPATSATTTSSPSTSSSVAAPTTTKPTSSTVAPTTLRPTSTTSRPTSTPTTSRSASSP